MRPAVHPRSGASNRAAGAETKLACAHLFLTSAVHLRSASTALPARPRHAADDSPSFHHVAACSGSFNRSGEYLEKGDISQTRSHAAASRPVCSLSAALPDSASFASSARSGGNVSFVVSSIPIPHASNHSMLTLTCSRCSSAIRNNTPSRVHRKIAILRLSSTTLRLRQLPLPQSTRHTACVSFWPERGEIGGG